MYRPSGSVLQWGQRGELIRGEREGQASEVRSSRRGAPDLHSNDKGAMSGYFNYPRTQQEVFDSPPGQGLSSISVLYPLRACYHHR